MRGLGQIAAPRRHRQARHRRDHERRPGAPRARRLARGVAEAKAELLAALPPGRHRRRPGQRPELSSPTSATTSSCGASAGDRSSTSRSSTTRTRALPTGRAGDRVAVQLHGAPPRPERARRAARVRALGLPLDEARRGSSQIAFSAGAATSTLPGGGVLINDAYNANPISMRAAIDHLVERASGRRRIAVLGEMAELGPDAPAYHREIGVHAAAAGVDFVIAVGPWRRSTSTRGRRTSPALSGCPRSKPRSSRSPTCCSRATACSSRLRAPQGSRQSRWARGVAA